MKNSVKQLKEYLKSEIKFVVQKLNYIDEQIEIQTSMLRGPYYYGKLVLRAKVNEKILELENEMQILEFRLEWLEKQLKNI